MHQSGSPTSILSEQHTRIPRKWYIEYRLGSKHATPDPSSPLMRNSRDKETMTGPAEAGERELIRLAQQGDADAFDQLVVRHQQAAFNIAYRMTRNRQEAEDVAQGPFVNAYQALDRFGTERPFAPWIARTATNTALNRIRGQQPERGLNEEILLAWLLGGAGGDHLHHCRRAATDGRRAYPLLRPPLQRRPEPDDQGRYLRHHTDWRVTIKPPGSCEPSVRLRPRRSRTINVYPNPAVPLTIRLSKRTPPWPSSPTSSNPTFL